MLALGFDTSGPHCAAALLRKAVAGTRGSESDPASDSAPVAERLELMDRGQAERLVPMIAEMLEGAGATWRDIAAIGVGVGPGSFTGIRIAVAFGRGLSLGLGVPAFGVDGCAARARLAPEGSRPAVPAPRDQVYLCPPAPAPMEAAPLQIADGDVAIDASRAAVAEAQCPIRLYPRRDAETEHGPLWVEASPPGLAEAIAREAALRLGSEPCPEPPAPLYLRAADAALPREAPPAILDDGA